MAISDEQRHFRAGRLGSSDARRLMAGDWHGLWLEKTGRVAPPDLAAVPAVQIGIVTEPLHARFYAAHSGIACRPAEATLVHPQFAFIVAHPDFLTWQRAEDVGRLPCDTLLEAKFSAGFKSDDELVQQYYWQIQHQLVVSGLEHAVLSLLRPASYATVAVERNARDAAVLLDTLHAFWWYVEKDCEPADGEPVPPPLPAGTRIFDMSRHNEFAAWAGILGESRCGMETYREAERALKALMPAEARVAFAPGAGAEQVFLTRSRDGRLALHCGELPDRHRRRAEPWQAAAG